MDANIPSITRLPNTYREEAYPRLRRSWNFSNELQFFEEVDHHATFGIGIYGDPRSPKFLAAFNLLDPQTLDDSLRHDGSGPSPGIQHPSGGWDTTPHRSRIINVDEKVLDTGAALFDSPDTPSLRARLVRPITVGQLSVLRRLAEQPWRMVDAGYHWSSGWHEKGAKEDGYIVWRTADQSEWDEVILQGPHVSLATPLAKQPNNPCRNRNDYSDLIPEALPERFIPRTNYQRACTVERYRAGYKSWEGRPYSSYWRVVWRRMLDTAWERSLQAALIPPGATHVDVLHSLALDTNRNTALVAGLWASLPFDYLVKVSGKTNLRSDLIDRFPAPLENGAAPYLLLRTLRLNCLTRDYTLLWKELFEESFLEDCWTSAFAHRPSLQDVTSEWTMATPLRTEYDRRAALVEIDALASLMLGITADQLCAIYRAQFGVLRKYEYRMFFDTQGRKIAKETHARGWKQQPGDYELAEQWYEENEAVDEDASADRPLPVALRDRYRPPLTKPDREAEMRAAYEEFERRLAGRSQNLPET